MDEIFHARLRQLREENSKTQAEIAEEIGVSLNTYSHYERQKKQPSLHTFASICLSLDMPAACLLNNTTKRNLTTEQQEKLKSLERPQLLTILNILRTLSESQG